MDKIKELDLHLKIANLRSFTVPEIMRMAHGPDTRYYRKCDIDAIVQRFYEKIKEMGS